MRARGLNDERGANRRYRSARARTTGCLELLVPGASDPGNEGTPRRPASLPRRASAQIREVMHPEARRDRAQVLAAGGEEAAPQAAGAQRL